MDSSEAEFIECMRVRPESEWALHTQHGTARCGEGADDFLVRLADVVRWFQRNHGLPFAVAVQRVIEGITADSLLQMFYLDGQANGWARPMWEPSVFDRYFDAEPEEGQSFLEWRAKRCIHSLRTSWLMPVWELERLVNTGRPDGEPREYDSDKETPFEFCERRGGHVADFSIRISKANELWGWGHAVALPDAVAGVQAAPTMEAHGVTDWPSLMRYRQQFVHLIEQKRYQQLPEWLPEHVALLAGQLQQECEAGRGRGALGRLAKELGYVRGQRVSELLKDAGYDVNTGEKPKPKATHWDAFGRDAKAGTG